MLAKQQILWAPGDRLRDARRPGFSMLRSIRAWSLRVARWGPALALLAGGLGVFAPRAHAQEAAAAQHKVIALGHFAFGGEVDFELGALDGDDDLEPSLGLAARAEFSLHRYVALGPQLGAVFWRGDAQEDLDLNRNRMLDLNAFLKFRLPFSASERYGEAYVGLPLGVSISFVNDEIAGLDDVDTGIGMNTGIMFGGLYALTDLFAVVAELGYLHHRADHDVGETDFDIRFGQFVMQLGFGVLLPR